MNLEPHEPIELTQKLICIPSFLGKESNVVYFIADWFRAHGFDEVEVQAVPLCNGGVTHQTIATLKGDGSNPSLMLCGHIDISDWQGKPFRESEWTHDPFGAEIHSGYLYGLGAINMKAGVAAIMMAAELVRRSGAKRRGDLIVACVAAETGGGVGAVHLINSGLRPTYCVVTEAGNLDVGSSRPAMFRAMCGQRANSNIVYHIIIRSKRFAESSMRLGRRINPSNRRVGCDKPRTRCFLDSRAWQCVTSSISRIPLRSCST